MEYGRIDQNVLNYRIEFRGPRRSGIILPSIFLSLSAVSVRLAVRQYETKRLLRYVSSGRCPARGGHPRKTVHRNMMPGLVNRVITRPVIQIALSDLPSQPDFPKFFLLSREGSTDAFLLRYRF